jgi:hypothetical protein
MGKVIALPVKKTRARSRTWSLSVFQQRAHHSQMTIQAACVSLTSDYKYLKRKKRGDYQQYSKVLQKVRELRHQTNCWSETMYDNERLPFLGRVLRYPLLSVCYHAQQRADELIALLMEICIAYSTGTPLIEEARMHQDIIRALTELLKIEKEVSFEITAMLDQIYFRVSTTS